MTDVFSNTRVFLSGTHRTARLIGHRDYRFRVALRNSTSSADNKILASSSFYQALTVCLSYLNHPQAEDYHNGREAMCQVLQTFCAVRRTLSCELAYADIASSRSCVPYTSRCHKPAWRWCSLICAYSPLEAVLIIERRTCSNQAHLQAQHPALH